MYGQYAIMNVAKSDYNPLERHKLGKIIMKPLPVIVGFGGFNAAGRASFHHSYRRTIYGSLPTEAKSLTVGSLAALMGLAKLKNNECVKLDGSKLSGKEFSELEQKVLEGSLVRKLSQEHFDSSAVPQAVSIPSEGAKIILDKIPYMHDINKEPGIVLHNYRKPHRTREYGYNCCTTH